MGGIKLMRDFTLNKFQQLCGILLDCGYCPITVCNYLEQRNHNLESTSKIIILRHDIDRKPDNALILAKLEHEMGIRSTYYFRNPKTFRPNIMREIQYMGHEIGYHYEVLAKAKGDPEKAIACFEKELQAMREFCDIKTICMHGSPLSNYDNRDLWRHYNFHDFGLIGEAYLSFHNSGLLYFSDTGRSWSGKHSLRDKITDSQSVLPINTTDDLIEQIKKYQWNGIYLTTHPERWTVNEIDWALSYSIDKLLNFGKVVLRELR